MAISIDDSTVLSTIQHANLFLVVVLVGEIYAKEY